MKTKKHKAADKFRQRVAFNLAKGCLLGDIHDPSIPQHDLFLKALSASKFASLDGKERLGARTYGSGWHGKQRPQRWLQALLDEIVQEYAEKNLTEWTERMTLSKVMHQRKLQEALDKITLREVLLANIKRRDGIDPLYATNALERSKNEFEKLLASGDYKDGLYIGYFPGVEIKPSNWINKNAINDVLHDHFVAIDIRVADYSKENILECNKLLNKIHERWNPYGQNVFFECLDFSSSDFICIDEADYLKKFISVHGSFDSEEHQFDSTIIGHYKEPDNVFQTYDVFSPAKISEFLISIPIYKDISNHPLLDFWLMDFASSVASFYWLIEAYQRRDRYALMPNISIKSQDILLAGDDLFWRNDDIEECLLEYGISKKDTFYEKYHSMFSLIRDKYHSILKKFGIEVSEIVELFKSAQQRNGVVYVGEDC